MKTNDTIDEWHTLTYLCLNEIEGLLGNKKFMISAVAENGYLFVWRAKDEKDKVQFEMDYSRRIHSGSIEALCVRNSNNKTVGVCCAGD